MKMLRTIFLRIRSLCQRGEVKREIDEELRFHVEQRSAENIAKGMTPEEAAREARKRFGNVQSVREECRETRGAIFFEATLRDLRFAFRQLVKNPGFTVVAVLTLALGIGACVAIFSVFNAVMLRPLPYPDPDRLVRLYTEFPDFPNGGLRRFSFSVPEYLDLRAEAKSWESLDAWISVGVNVGGKDQPVRVTGASVTGSLFRSIGATPMLGRAITPEDDVPGGPQIVVISYGLWQRTFAGDHDILGRDLVVDGNKLTVVGVMPKDFRFPIGEINETEIWGPLQIDPAHPGERDNHSLNLIGRLRPSVDLGQAQAEIRSLEKHWGEMSGHRLDGTDHTIVSYGLHDEVVRGVRPALRMLMGAVAFLLLIACVNVANLLLGRAESRRREIAIRGALGAGLERLGLQFVIEGLVLACAGVAAGLLLAQGALAFLKPATLSSIPRAGEVAIDARVGIFAAALALVTGLAFGLAPLAHVVRRNLKDALNSGGASTTGSAGTQHFRQALVVGQLALSLTLLIGTGLMLRAFWNLQEVNAGFDPKNVVTMSVALPDATYHGQSVLEFWTRLETQLNSIPGIRGAALASGLPPIYGECDNTTPVEGYVPTEGSPPQNVQFYQSVSQGYFETMGIRLVQGRFFDNRDSAEAPEVAIINQSMQRTFWGNESAIGHRIRPFGTTNWCTIVGVIADVKNAGLEKPAGSELYLPLTQNAGLVRAQQMFVVVRAPVNPGAIVTAVRRELGRMDPTLPLANVRDMEAVMRAAQSRPRVFTLLLTSFAIVALVLASVGIYGVIAYSVAQRTKELGLRMALGAQRGDVFRMVLGRGMLLALAGIGIGLIGAFVLTRFLSGLLFGITPTDPATFVMVSLLFSAVAFLAIYLPARRATKINPMEALRHE
jgi:predicted permease